MGFRQVGTFTSLSFEITPIPRLSVEERYRGIDDYRLEFDSWRWIRFEGASFWLGGFASRQSGVALSSRRSWT